MKLFVCKKCGLSVPMTPMDFPLICRCQVRYESFADMDGEPSYCINIGTGGVGTELQEMFKDIGAKPSTACQCEAKAAEMDNVGIETVKTNRSRYLEWLREAYQSL